MNNKRRIIIIICIIVFIVIAFIILRKSLNKNIYINKQMDYREEIVPENSMEAIERLNKSIEKCKELYELNNKKNFDIYFGISMIDSNYENGNVRMLSGWNEINTEYIKIYNSDGEKIDEFLDNVEFDRNINQIEYAKTYLLRVSPNDDKYVYYCTFYLNKDYSTKIEMLCYTQRRRKKY